MSQKEKSSCGSSGPRRPVDGAPQHHQHVSSLTQSLTARRNRDMLGTVNRRINSTAVPSDPKKEGTLGCACRPQEPDPVAAGLDLRALARPALRQGTRPRLCAGRIRRSGALWCSPSLLRCGIEPDRGGANARRNTERDRVAVSAELSLLPGHSASQFPHSATSGRGAVRGRRLMSSAPG
jgi:hypothetical protein